MERTPPPNVASHFHHQPLLSPPAVCANYHRHTCYSLPPLRNAGHIKYQKLLPNKRSHRFHFPHFRLEIDQNNKINKPQKNIHSTQISRDSITFTARENITFESQSCLADVSKFSRMTNEDY
ncbi:hypothetical protein L798_00160 [Zootermopsis nevadensis]|uniref:Uncharacterized protein n=1 Tax=Zootermopsis nevadensis TaxID=136037 RepID=A0A067RII0_ZOONE|nr:hypothetical protein L798_00160 [Zootermopsis nevadensis]